MSTLSQPSFQPQTQTENASLISDLRDEISRLKTFADPHIYAKYEKLQDASDRKDESILALRSRCRENELALEENQQTITALQKNFEIEIGCASFKEQQLTQANRNLKLQQLQANVETCNCASKLVHARCVMREMEIDLVHQQFKVEQARKRIAKDKSDMQGQQRFANELKQQVEKLKFQRDSFHETTMNLIATLDKANKQTAELRKRYQVLSQRFTELEEEKDKVESLLKLEHESKAKLEEEKSKEIEQSLGTIESVRKKLEQETERRLEAEKDAKKARIESTSLAKQNEGYMKRIERLEEQLDAKTNESQQQLCDRLNAIQDEMKKLQQQKVVVVSPGKMSVDCESVDYRITPERLLAARARSKQSQLSAIVEQGDETRFPVEAEDDEDVLVGEEDEIPAEEAKPQEDAEPRRPSRKPKRKAAPVVKRKTPPRKAKQRKTSPKDVTSQAKPVATRRSRRGDSPVEEKDIAVEETQTRPKRQKKPTRKIKDIEEDKEKVKDIADEKNQTRPKRQKKPTPKIKDTEEDKEEENSKGEAATEADPEFDASKNVTHGDTVEAEEGFDDDLPAAEPSPVLQKQPPAVDRKENATKAANADPRIQVVKKPAPVKSKPASKASRPAQTKKRKLMGKKKKFVGPSSFGFKFIDIDRKSAPKLKANVKR